MRHTICLARLEGWPEPIVEAARRACNSLDGVQDITVESLDATHVNVSFDLDGANLAGWADAVKGNGLIVLATPQVESAGDAELPHGRRIT